MPIQSKPQFPPEIWSHTLSFLFPLQQKKLLGVSRLFHDIAVRSLFSDIKIYFIGGMSWKSTETTFPSSTEEVSSRLLGRSWEILDYICQNVGFSQMIKSITVICFADSQSVFEMLSLGKALRSLSNLRTFRWIGVQPGLTKILADCIPPSVHNLVVQSYISPTKLRHLTSITALHLPIPFFYPDDEEVLDTMIFDPVLSDYATSCIDVQGVFDSLSSPLHSLRILTNQIGRVPVRVYDSLTTLEICAPDEADLAGLEFVFHHATALESLSLIGHLGFDVFSILPSDASTLPRLQSFRLSSDSLEMPYIGETHLYTLTQLLKTHPMLRRLYIRLPSADWTISRELLEVIAVMPALEVFGFHTGSEYVAQQEIEHLALCLSPRLKALHLSIGWGSEFGFGLLSLIDRLGQLPNLTFLHLYGNAGRLPLRPDALAAENKLLTTVGLNRALWDIDRDGPELETLKWPRYKVKYCTEEDFCCKDDAWLFKYN